MAVSNITPVFATVTNDTLAFEDTDTTTLEQTEVLYDKAGSYFVTIPKIISLGADKQSPYSVKVEGDIPSDKQVYVSPIDGIKDLDGFNFYMKDQSITNPKADVVATVTQNKFYWNFSEVADGYAETNNQVTAEDLTSGTWKGTFDFEINMHKVEPERPDFTLTTDGDVTLPVGESHQLNAYIDGIESNSDVLWSCNNEDITINNGLIEIPSTIQAGTEITITVSKDSKTISFTITVDDDKKTLEAGLYDADDNLIVSWSDSGINNTCSNAKGIVGDTYPNTVKVVIGESVTSITDGAFAGCTLLTEVVIPDSVTNIDSAIFYNCTSLKSVVISDSITSLNNSTFQDCTSLTEVTIPDSVTSIGEHAFEGCVSLRKVVIPDSVTSIGVHAFDECTLLTEATIPDSVTSIGASAFQDCKSLTDLTIPDSVKEIGNGAFNNCTLLTKVIIPNSVTRIDLGVFQNCTSLMEVTIPQSVINISNYAFQGCTSLTKVTIPNSVTSIGICAFKNCTSLTEVEIPDSVKEIGNMAFEGCTSLTEVIIPDSVITIGYNAFYNVSHITYNGTHTLNKPWGALSIN